MKIRFSLLLTLFFISSFSFAQNARFSQIWSAPMMYNPSLCGRFDGQARAGALLSWQKTDVTSTPQQDIYVDCKLGRYKTLGDMEVYDSSRVNAIKKLKEEAKEETKLKKDSKGYWAVGFNYYHYGTDLLGFVSQQSPVKANFYALNLAHHFYLKNNRYIGIGGQAVYADASAPGIKNSPFKYDKEISGGAFDYSLYDPTGTAKPDSFASSKHYFDANIGAYFGLITEQLSFEIGGAMYHLFYPSDGLGDKERELRHRVTLHTVFRFKLAPHWAMVQKNMYWGEGLYWRSHSQGDSLHIIALWSGVDFYRTNPKSDYNVGFGLYTRSFRTVLPYISVNLGKVVNVRYSYEFPFNSANFNAYTARRSEIAFIFTTKRNTTPGNGIYKKLNYW